MPTPEARRARLGHLYELLAGTDTVEEFVADLARVAVEHMDVRVSCGLTARQEGRTVTIASSDELAAELDRIQNTTDQGPGPRAIATGETIHVTDPAVATWTAWREIALRRGVTQALSLPLIARGATLGALNLYSISNIPFTAEDHEAAENFAAHATGTLMVASRLAQLADLTGHLEAALTSRAAIDQAKGILIAENGCTPDEAFTLLRQASQNRNMKLRDLATQIVAQASHRPDDITSSHTSVTD